MKDDARLVERQARAGGLARVGVFGSLLGRNAGSGIVTTQGEVLADLLRGEGHAVLEASSAPGKARRAAGIAGAIAGRGRGLDAILIQTHGGAALRYAEMAALVARATGAGRRTVLHLHGGSLPEMASERKGRARLKRLFGSVGALVAPSRFLGRMAEELGFGCRVIPNVIRLSDYPAREFGEDFPRPRLFWMRTFHEIYNPRMALRAAAALRGEYPELRLTFAGQERDAGLLADLRREAEELGMGGSVRFEGFLDGAGKAREGSWHDFYLHTNAVDNTPVSVLEAGAMGMAVVATRAGGVPDLLTDGVNAALVEPGDAEGMAEAIRGLLRDRERARRLARGARELAEGFDWSRVYPMWRGLFEDLAGVREAGA